MNMQKMRWFIIGNLIGFAILFCGIAVKERNKDGSDQSTPAATEAAPSGSTGTTTFSESQPPAVDEAKSESAQNADANSGEGLVTTRDITKGTTLHAGDVELRKIDRKHIKADGFSTVENALGLKTKVDLVEGEVLQTSDLESK